MTHLYRHLSVPILIKIPQNRFALHRVPYYIFIYLMKNYITVWVNLSAAVSSLGNETLISCSQHTQCCGVLAIAVHAVQIYKLYFHAYREGRLPIYQLPTLCINISLFVAEVKLLWHKCECCYAFTWSLTYFLSLVYFCLCWNRWGTFYN